MKTPARTIERRRRLASVQKSLDGHVEKIDLLSEERIALVRALRLEDGMTFAAIGEVMGVSVNTACKVFHRGDEE